MDDKLIPIIHHAVYLIFTGLSQQELDLLFFVIIADFYQHCHILIHEIFVECKL